MEDMIDMSQRSSNNKQDNRAGGRERSIGEVTEVELGMGFEVFRKHDATLLDGGQGRV